MTDNGGAARRSGRRWLWIIAGVAGAGAIAAVVAIWHLPARMYPAHDQADARAALQGGLLTAAAALTAVAGALIALDETRQANAETKAANVNTHVRELYVEAVKLLNEPDNLGIRLGGIYALERIAVDSPADQRTVVEVLSAFVRTRSTDPALRPAPPTESPADGTAADVRAAVQVLARLPYRKGVPRADLTGADLTGPAGLDGLTLTDADLRHVDLRDAHITNAQLDKANLTRARLDGANLTDAWLDGANLTNALLDKANLTRARLDGANLTDAWLDGANLTNARLRKANLTNALLAEANLTRARLDGANLTRARLDRVNAWMDGANLTRARLDEANLTDARLDGANLTDAQGLTPEQVNGAIGDARTLLPVGFVRPSSWSS
jgi:uncharacterized protein YjbI with pentapeptide repeats